MKQKIIKKLFDNINLQNIVLTKSNNHKEKQRIKIRLGDVSVGDDFYWDNFMCFGGWVIKHTLYKITLIMDSGCDGNTYTKEIVSSNKKVYIEIKEEENESKNKFK